LQAISLTEPQHRAGTLGPDVRIVLATLVGALALAAPAQASGPFMMFGTADDVVKSQDTSVAHAQMDLLKLAGMDTVRVTTIWKPGEKELAPVEAIVLRNAVDAGKIAGVRVVVTVMHAGSRTTPLTPEAQQEFATFTADVARRLPGVRDFIVANEPNLNRFWMPQYDPLNGASVSAGAYVSLLAQTYDAIKAVRPFTTVYGGALAPRGIDRPGTGRDTHSPTKFIRDMGAAYRASGRAVPIMDAFAFHPYADNSSQPPDFPHPNSTVIGIADYGKLVALLAEAFDGTAQHGSTLPILYDEFGVETTIPGEKERLYVGNEPTTTKPVDDATQAAYYRKGLELSFCQPNVLGYLTFHAVDEKERLAWQSGLYYADGSPKASLAAVRTSFGDARRGIVAQCEGLQLTPQMSIVFPSAARLKQRSFKVTFSCPIDCSYTIRLERLPYLTPVVVRAGSAIGRTQYAQNYRFARPLARGTYRFAVHAEAVMNAGPPFDATSAALRIR
jgi:hypothetical protein